MQCVAYAVTDTRTRYIWFENISLLKQITVSNNTLVIAQTNKD